MSFDGYVFWSTDPGGPAGAWHAVDVDGQERDTHLMSVSCPSVFLCVAVSGERYTAGKVLTSTDPSGGADAWSVVQLEESLDLRGVSCGTPRICVAVGESGRMIVSTNPIGGLQGWRDIGLPGGPGDMRGVSCAGITLCAAGNFGGNILAATDPAAGAGAWSERNGGSSVLITGISCLEKMGCVAVDNNGDVLSSTKPLGGSSDWSFQNVIPFQEPAAGEQPDNAMFGVSCPSFSFCAIAAASARVFTSTSPFAEPSPAPGGQKRRKRLRPRTRLAHVDRRHLVTAKGWTPVRFRFYANGKVRGFLCRLDKRPIKRCHSPKRYRRVSIGRHVFRVRAIGVTGSKGPIALERFRIVPNRNAKGP